MEDKLSIDGWNYWLRLPNWPLDVALSVLTGYDPRGANSRYYFKHNSKSGNFKPSFYLVRFI